jgi:exosortase A-associated hydrolase 2
LADPLQAFFVPANDRSGGLRLYLHYPVFKPRAAIVYVHPFAEEMNKSRRMASLQARAMSEAGYSVLQPDLLGCGDSSGDFGDASWQAWIDDVVAACDWMRSRFDAPLWLWGMRAGCLLAAEAARRVEDVTRFLFWQPVPSGKGVLQQFLRSKAAGDLREGSAKAVMAELRRRLTAGEAVDINGYSLAPELAMGLERAELTPPPTAQRLEWLEVSSRIDVGPAAWAAASLERWEQSGCKVRTRLVTGPQFWHTVDIEEAPALIGATLGALDDHASVAA